MPRPVSPSVPHTRAQLLVRLDDLGVAYELHEHPAVFTVEEAAEHTDHLPGEHTKNLFLKDKKDGLWLITAPHRQDVRMGPLAKALGAPRFSFGKQHLLMDALGVEPGSVTPLAVINDESGAVTMVLDARLAMADLVNVHPLENTATLALSGKDLVRFLEATGHSPRLLDLSTVAE